MVDMGRGRTTLDWRHGTIQKRVGERGDPKAEQKMVVRSVVKGPNRESALRVVSCD